MDVVNYNNDCLFEILVRVDPADIANCILVSKDWLEVITSCDFGTNYLSKWKGKLAVGLMLYNYFGFVEKLNMLPITGLGRQLNDNTLIPERSRIGYFVSKSPNSSHMLFVKEKLQVAMFPPITYERTLHVWTGGPTIGSPLPPPPVCYESFRANILCDDDGNANSYKVIMAEFLGKETNTVNIQTFCSSTRLWEQSVLTCSISFLLRNCHGSGAATTSVIYWEARSRKMDCLAAWDINGGSNLVSLIPEPEFPSLLRIPFYEGREIPRQQYNSERLPPCYYGISPNDSLLSAISSTSHTKYPLIKIFSFDENTKDWSLLHQVKHETIWTNNLGLLSSLFGDGAKLHTGFIFLSFLRRPDSILLGLEQHNFLYHLESQKLEYLDFSKHLHTIPYKFRRYTAYHPLTLQDLGVWLSSPPSISLEGGNRKHILPMLYP